MRARVIERAAQKSHDSGARTCAPARTRSVASSSSLEKSISRSTFNVPRGEISGNWPYKVHISRLVTVIPFCSSGCASAGRASAGRAARGARCALFAFRFFFHDRDEISGGSVDRVPPRRTGLAQCISIEPGFERFACHGSGGSEPSAGRRRRGRVFSFQFSRIYPKYRHLPPPPTPSRYPSPLHPLPISLFSRAGRCLRKNTEFTIDRGDIENHSSLAGSRIVPRERRR